MNDSKSPIETPSHRAKRTLSRRVKKVQPVVELKLSRESISLTLDPPDPPPIPFKHINAPEQIRGNVGSGGVASLQIDSNPPIAGEVQLIAGTNISLSQTGQVVTINATGAGSLTPANFVIGEDLTSQVGGVTFVLAGTPILNKEEIFINGIRLRRGIGNDYTISGVTITMNFTPISGDVVEANYIK